MSKIARSIVKSVDIKASKSTVFSFLADPMNWPKWAIVNLQSVDRDSDGWFKMTTRRGTGYLKMHLHEELGIFDHTWKDPHATWTVPSRIVPNGEGATVMITFFQPPVMSTMQFEAAMQDIEVEMAKLKEVLEQRGSR